MSTLQSLLQTPLFESIGWSLIHLTWQATIVALLLAAIITTFRPQSSSTRYLLSVLALALIALLPLITAYQHYTAVASGKVDGGAVVAAVSGTGMTQSLTVASLGKAALRDVFSALKNDIYLLLTAAVPYLLIVWALGVVLFSVRLVAAFIQARKLTREGLAPAPAYCLAALERISEALGLQRGVRLFVSELVEVPSVIGYVRPMVLLPVSCLSGLTIEQLESILAHELAHVRRYDFVVNCAQSIVETLFFFHPAVWWVSAQIRAERENACDDLAVEVCGDARVYAKALTLLEQMRPQFAAVSVAATGGCLLSRIKRLLKINSAEDQFSTRWLAGFTLGALAAIVVLIVPFSLAAQASKVLPETGRLAQTEPARKAGTSVDVVASASEADPGDRDSEGDYETDEATAVDEESEPQELHFEFEFDSEEIEHQVEMAEAAAERASEELRASELVLAAFEEEGEAPCPDKLKEHAKRAREMMLADKAHRKMAEKMARRSAEDVHIDLSSLDEEHLAALARAGVDRSLVRSLAEIGCEASTVNELKSLRAVGVTAAYVKSLQGTVGDLDSIDQLRQLRALGVDAAYARSLRAAGYDADDSEELVAAKALGVDATYAREMKRRLDLTDIEELGQLRAVGVTTAYLDDLKALGFHELDAGEVSGARAVGVTKPFVVALRTAGLRDISLDDAIELRAVGVTPGDVRAYRQATGERPSASDVIDAKHRNIASHALSELDAQRAALRRNVEEIERERARERKRSDRGTRSR